MYETFFIYFVIFASIQNVKSLLIEGLKPCLFEINSTLTQEGEIFSPNYPSPYPNNLNCRYEFHGSENELIIIEPEDFQLEAPNGVTNQNIDFMDFVETRANNNAIKEPKESTASNYYDRQCFYDFLDVFTTNIHGTIIWHSRHCGSTIQKRIVSTSPTLFLVFQTDRMLAYKGFKFRYSFSNLDIFPLTTQTKICGSSSIAGAGGVLSSPNYPYKYPENTDCAWTITVKSDQQILIKFVDINFEEVCKMTYVNIWDGYVSNVNQPDMSVCDQLKYYHKGFKEFISKSNRIVIKFETEKQKFIKKREFLSNEMQSLFKNDKGGLKKGGFSLIWTAVSLKTNCDGFRCKGGKYCIDSGDNLCHTTNEYCISRSLQCDGILHCDNKDESDESLCGLQNISIEIVFIAVLCCVIVILSLVVIFIRKLNNRRFNDRNRQNQETKLKIDSMDLIQSPLIFEAEKITSDEDKSLIKIKDCMDAKETSVTTFKQSKFYDTKIADEVNFINNKRSNRNSILKIEQECMNEDKKFEVKKSKDKILTSISQHDMATIEHEELDNTSEENLDSKSIITRRNSYTLAIFENE